MSLASSFDSPSYDLYNNHHSYQSINNKKSSSSEPSINHTKITMDEAKHSSSSMNDTKPPSWLNMKSVDWGLSVTIFFLVPLFFVKLAQVMFPVKDAPQNDLRPEDDDEYDKYAKRQMDFQWVSLLTLGAIGTIIAIALAMIKGTSRGPILGLCYGSLATIVFGLYSNYGRINNVACVSIVGVFLIACLFLPRLSQHVLLK